MNAALGFSLHTGWAAALVVIRDGRKIEAIGRRRLELLPQGTAIPRFIYHRAAELPIDEASALVESAGALARSTATEAIQEMLSSVHVIIRAAGIPRSSATPPNDLFKILGVHSLIHAAEGQLFCQAVIEGCESCGVGAVTIRNREVWPKAAALCGMAEKRLHETIDAIGKEIGPPWSADQKLATAAGLVALMQANQATDPVTGS
jgi:hypothetical protein